MEENENNQEKNEINEVEINSKNPINDSNNEQKEKNLKEKEILNVQEKKEKNEEKKEEISKNENENKIKENENIIIENENENKIIQNGNEILKKDDIIKNEKANKDEEIEKQKEEKKETEEKEEKKEIEKEKDKEEKKEVEKQKEEKKEVEKQKEEKKEIEKQKEEKKEEEKEKEEKEEKEEPKKDETTNEYIFRCETCHLIPKIQIDKKTYKLFFKCQNNHIKTNISLSQALDESKNFSMKTCSACGEKSEEDNYICIQCLKIFCVDGGCKKKHSKENPSHKLIDVNNYDITCLEHLTNYSKYCKDCKKNICIKCQRAHHMGHQLIDLGEILPIPEEIEDGKKIFESKKEKLLKLKELIYNWVEEFKTKLKTLYDLIDAQIEINENILKKFKTDLMNYQMIENFNYFSSRENLDKYSSNELISFALEKNWLPKTFLISQILTKIEKPIEIKDEEPKNQNDNRVNINNNINNNNNPNNLNLKKSISLKIDDKEKEEKSNSSNQLRLKNIKTYSSPIIQKEDLRFGKDFYWNLNQTKNKGVCKRAFKANISITENIHSCLIDNKGIIFLGGDSCLSIFRFDQKNGKIEKEFQVKGLDGSVNTISELRDDFLIVGTSNNTIKIIEFLGNKKYRIHQEIRNLNKDSIYKIIEISNFYLISCNERYIILFSPKKNNYYEICQEIKLDTPTCCILQISENIIAASQFVLNKISFYEYKKHQLELKKGIENIELSLSNNSLAIINNHYFCSVAKQNINIISTDKLELVKKIDLKMNIINLFPIFYGAILLCNCKEREKGKLDYSLSVKTFNEKDNDLLLDYDQLIVGKNNNIDDIFYLNFFNPNYMIMVTQSNISIWG